MMAQRDQKMARPSRDQVAPQEFEKRRIETAAEAERRRCEAQGEADAILAKYEAEAKGVQQVMEAKAGGYRKLIEVCGSDAAGPTLLLIEQRVKAVQGLKIGNITVWDQGTGRLGPQRDGGLPVRHDRLAPAAARTRLSGGD